MAGRAILYNNDIDKSVVFGRRSIGNMEHARQNKRVDIDMLFKYNRLFIGTVNLVREDVYQVDIEYGQPSNKGLPHKVYRYCKVMQGHGVNEDGDYWGDSHLPELGSEVVCGFLNNMEEHPVVLGGLITKRDGAALAELQTNGVAKNKYYKLGKSILLIKPDGTIELKNDIAQILIEPTGKMALTGLEVKLNNGTLGVARKLDAVTLTLTSADVVALATALLATGAFVPSGVPPAPAPPPPPITGGQITGGSVTVLAGN